MVSPVPLMVDGMDAVAGGAGDAREGSWSGDQHLGAVRVSGSCGRRSAAEAVEARPEGRPVPGLQEGVE